MAAADSSTWLPTSFCGKKRRRVSDEGDSSMQPHSPVPVGRPLVQPISPTGAASSSATSRGGQNKATSALEESRPAGLPSGAGATASEHNYNIDIQHSRTLSRAALKSIRLTRPQTVEQLVIQKNSSLRDIVRDRDLAQASEPPEDQVDEELAQLAEILALSKQEFESREFRLGESHDVLVAKLFAYGLRERDVEGDGNCQFRALSDQLYGTEKHHATVRTKVVTQLERGGEFYKHFVAGATSFNTSSTTRSTTTTSASAPASNDLPDDVFSLYLVRMSEDKEWGDHVTLQAAADAYDCEIRLITSYDEDAVVTISPLQYGKRSDDGQTGPGRRPVLWLAFWAEVHYNSLEDDPEGEGQ